MGAERVEIVGAGPVGLLAALCALDVGLEPIVYERRASIRGGTRSIGIHPPSLERLDRLGIAGRFLDRGVRVERGIAVGAGGVIGAVDFGCCFGRHRYVLSLPQADTEKILRDALDERAPGCVLTGRDFDPTRNAGSDAVALIACDGKHSRVRKAAGIVFDGGSYEGAYAMADCPDGTQLESTAAVFLGRGGLVESFPLPGRRRRWVIRRERETGVDATAEELVETVYDRTKHRIAASDVSDLTSFRAERYLASTLASGRLALAGDAAHIVSPIGGQGMNLGWLGVADLMDELSAAVRSGRPASAALARNARARRRMARAAAGRAEVNMWLGRPTNRPRGRELIVATLMRQPLQALLANLFTMRGLATGI